jgi:hypothetical protein
VQERRNIWIVRIEWLIQFRTLLNRYHVPRSFLQPGSNDLVLFEQFGGDPSKISFTTKQTASVCAHVSEDHPDQIDSWISPQQKLQRSGPALRLECPKAGQVISSIKFASFGTPSGTCGNYNHGECSSSQALAVAREVTPICPTFTITMSFCSVFLARYWQCCGKLRRHALGWAVAVCQCQLNTLEIHVQESQKALR